MCLKDISLGGRLINMMLVLEKLSVSGFRPKHGNIAAGVARWSSLYIQKRHSVKVIWQNLTSLPDF